MQFKKAFDPISVRPFGRTTSCNDSQELNTPDSILLSFSGNFTFSKLVQPEKVPDFKVETPSGMAIDVKAEQPENKDSPMLVKLLGIDTSVNPVQ
nr:hypothetical protein [Ruminococcus callidus]